MSPIHPISPQEVVESFARFTGITFRVMPHSVQRQASEFCKAGFTLRDLELVIAWTRKRIAQNQGGYSASSLQWRVLFGNHGAADEMVVFQERLGLAEADMKRNWRPKLTSDVLPSDPAPVIATPAADLISDEEAARIRDSVKAQHVKFKQSLLGTNFG